jgi:endo-beta-N-acetylglucosaminidase D
MLPIDYHDIIFYVVIFMIHFRIRLALYKKLDKKISLDLIKQSSKQYTQEAFSWSACKLQVLYTLIIYFIEYTDACSQDVNLYNV